MFINSKESHLVGEVVEVFIRIEFVDIEVLADKRSIYFEVAFAIVVDGVGFFFLFERLGNTLIFFVFIQDWEDWRGCQ